MPFLSPPVAGRAGQHDAKMPITSNYRTGTKKTTFSDIQEASKTNASGSDLDAQLHQPCGIRIVRRRVGVRAGDWGIRSGQSQLRFVLACRGLSCYNSNWKSSGNRGCDPDMTVSFIWHAQTGVPGRDPHLLPRAKKGRRDQSLVAVVLPVHQWRIRRAVQAAASAATGR